jgi:hypothetical protein
LEEAMTKGLISSVLGGLIAFGMLVGISLSVYTSAKSFDAIAKLTTVAQLDDAA